uniref:Beta-1,4-galactosyltransferase n=1 Tax=Meloidogyne javanica TaxID=6303 RepID=A0A915MQS7_MELJA
MPSNKYFLIKGVLDNLRFNRASLLNIGSLQAKKENCDYIALHDIDIVPLNPALNYSYPGEGQLFHITPGKYHPIKREAGLSNNITRPDGLNTSRSNTFLHVHNKSDKRDYVHADYKKKALRELIRLN